MARIDERLLDDKLAELEKMRTFSPRVVSKLEALLRADDEWALYRANPYAFAEERGVGEDEAVEIFLLAAKVGLFQMTWSLLCPACGAAVQSFATLRSVCSAFHCALCSIDVETRLDDFVHVGFTVSPKVRVIAAHDPESLSARDFFLRYYYTREARIPDGTRFVDVLASLTQMHYLAAGETGRWEVELVPGTFSVHDVLAEASFPVVVAPSAGGPNALRRWKLSEGRARREPPVLAPGKLSIEIENDTGRRGALMFIGKPQAIIDLQASLEAAGEASHLRFDKFLSGRRLLSSQTFRNAFGTETIRSAEGLGVRDVSILFTDLKGSTSLYDSIGDLKAFSLVNQHFERLGRAIAQHRGAVVKTIGDAVMASFESPADAVRAARDMLKEIDAFNAEVGEGHIILKVGIHRGASIAVTLNERLDYFGQTVNIAARVQGLADADEIYLTEDVYTVPGVADLVKGLHVSTSEAQLRGVQRPVRVYRLTSPPA